MSRTRVFTAAILCLILAVHLGSAQGLYLTANAGYGLGAGTQEFGYNSTSSGPTYSYEGVYGSLGEGVKFGVSGGYMFNENIGTEVGVSYWLGKSIEFTTRSSETAMNDTWSGSGFVALPSIIVSANMKTINPYARFGLVFGLVKVTEEITGQQTGQAVAVTLEETGNFAFGYAGALGVVVPTGGKVDFFGEVSLYAVTYSPGQAEVTLLTVNGVNQLASLSQKVTEYKDSWTSPGGTSSGAVRRPLSSIGLQVGLRINL